MTDNIAIAPAYIVRRNGRKLPNKVFATYDQARSWVRRKLRSLRKDEQPGAICHKEFVAIDGVDQLYRTPQLALHGYSISKVGG